MDGREMGDADRAPIHDALALCAAIDPVVLTEVVYMRADVECREGPDDGLTLIDPCGDPNARVALGADRGRFVRLLIETLSRGAC